jgi:putative membrane protein
MHWPGWGFGILPMFFVLFFWVAIAALVVFIIVKLVGGITSPKGHMSEAEEILKQRYARGEITKEQYDEMLERIRR